MIAFKAFGDDQPDREKPDRTTGQVIDGAGPVNEKPTDDGQIAEIMSDGSASAFEGTEFRDQDDRERFLEKNRKIQTGPSGRKDY